MLVHIIGGPAEKLFTLYDTFPSDPLVAFEVMPQEVKVRGKKR